MECLPNELLHLLFSFLPVRDLKKVRLVNRLFSDISVIPLFSEAHLVLARESAERLINLSCHVKLRPLITSLLYEANPLDRFDEPQWTTHVRNGNHSTLCSQPRDPNRWVSLRDQHQQVHENISTAKTRNALKAGWAAYSVIHTWQRERLVNHTENRVIYRAVSEFPNLKTIKIYIGPFTSYGQKSFASTFLPYTGRRRIWALNLSLPGLPNLLGQAPPTTSSEEKVNDILSRIKVMYLDEIEVTSIPDPSDPLSPSIYCSLHWLQDLRIAFESRQKYAAMAQPYRDRINRFLRHAPNLQKLDIGWTHYGASRHYNEPTELFSVLGDIRWAHLTTIMLRGWRVSTASFLAFCQRHQETLQSINLDCCTVMCDNRDPWGAFLKDLRQLKRWKSVEIWGSLRDLNGNLYIVGWPPETAWVKNGTSSYWEYVNEPVYYEYTKQAREQIERYALGQTDVNPFSKRGVVYACSIIRDFKSIKSEFSNLVPGFR